MVTPIVNILQKLKTVSISDLNGMLESGGYLETVSRASDMYEVNGSQVILKGLGVDNCIFCGKYSDYNYFKFNLPEAFGEINPRFKDGIFGHMGCFQRYGIFNYISSPFKCGDCENWSIKEESEIVKENCAVTGLVRLNLDKSLSDDPVCIYFEPADEIFSNPNIDVGLNKRMNEWIKSRIHFEEQANVGYVRMSQYLKHLGF